MKSIHPRFVYKKVLFPADIFRYLNGICRRTLAYLITRAPERNTARTVERTAHSAHINLVFALGDNRHWINLRLGHVIEYIARKISYRLFRRGNGYAFSRVDRRRNGM